ncbi:hypothetical protein FRC14_005780 [Serendipita sp. 396]|nr:hypothetical protein FRC14_005780 [Serendipita sp. 396]KAG8830248.1 hypothetical protein FRC18_008391 [Serendipita sp. 400]
MQTFKIGIYFRTLEPNGVPQQRVLLPVRYASTSHWILIFTAGGESRSFELHDQSGTITYIKKRHPYEVPAHYFGEYTGRLADLDQLAQYHPMNGQKYSKWINNCQHWAAHYLDILARFVKNTPHQSISITKRDTLKVIASVVDTKAGMSNNLNDALTQLPLLLAAPFLLLKS